jgi:hypothetical protein
MNKKLLLRTLSVVLLVACAPDAPHQWINKERRYIENHCPFVKGNGSKVINSRHNVGWLCLEPKDFMEWEAKFIGSMSDRGWYIVQTTNPWKSMCHKDVKGVVLRYSTQLDDDKQSYLGMRLYFPANECAS